MTPDKFIAILNNEAGEVPTRVKDLLDRGACVNGIDSVGTTPLGWACGHGSWYIVEQLLRHGADANQKSCGSAPLTIACRLGHDGTIETLLTRGSTFSLQSIAEPMSIHCDATKKLEIVRLLLDHGANVNFGDGDDRATLNFVCLYEGNLKLVRELLSRGASLDICDDRGRLPVNFARGKILEVVVCEMLSRRTSINWQDRNGCTFLHCAARYGELGLVQMLLNDGADIDLRTNQGESALMLACFRERLEAVRELLSRGAKFNMSEVESRVKSDELRTVLEQYASGIDYVMK